MAIATTMIIIIPPLTIALILFILHNIDDLSLGSVLAGLVVLVELWLGGSVA